jgi:tetratricopeptide (TPR) repeat protein
MKKNKSIIICYIAILLFSCNKYKQKAIIITKEYSYEFNDYYSYLEQIKKYLLNNEFDVNAHRSYQDVELELDNYSLLKSEYLSKLKNNTNSALYNYLYGRLVYYSSSYPSASNMAINYFEKSLKLDPYFPWSYNAIANIYMAENRMNEAQSLLEKCIDNCPEFVESYISLSKIYLKKQGPEIAISYINNTLNKFRSNYELKIYLADQYILINNFKSAHKILNGMLSDYKDDYRYHRILYKLIKISSPSNKKEKMLKYYWESYPNSDNIINVFDDLFELYKHNNINKAIEFSRGATTFKTRIKRLKSIAYDRLIEIYKNNVNRLNQLGEEILNSEMRNTNTINKCGELLLNSEKEETAILLFEKAYNSCNWNDLKNNVIFGTITNENERDSSIAMHKNIAMYNLGKAYFKIHDIAKSMYYFKKINETDNVLNEDSYLYLANCYQAINNINEAKKILKYTYYKYGSKKAHEHLMLINSGNNDIIFNKESNYKNISDIRYLMNFNNKYIVLGLYETDCKACLIIFDIITKIEKKYLSSNDIVFLNIFYENNANLYGKNIFLNKELYYEIVSKLGINNIPYILFIDKKKNIIYTKIGMKDNEDNMDDIEYKIGRLIRR